MRALDLLAQDHRWIERVIERALTALDALEGPELRATLDFFSEYADGVHHAREERALFPAMAERAQSMVHGPLSVMLREHEMGRAYLKAARASLDEALAGSDHARSRLAASVRAYAALMRGHIRREDQVLYPIAEKVLGAEQDAQLVQSFAKLDREHADLAQYWARFASGAIAVHTLVVRVRHSVAPPSARTLSESPHDDDELGETSGKAGVTLFDDGAHRALWLHDYAQGLSVQANQFLLVSDGEGMILDPGGPKVYPSVFAEVMLHVTPETLRYIFLSHQDPDVGTSINSWLMDTEADAYISRLWVRFLPHFGIDRLLRTRLKAISDDGARLRLGQTELLVLPAHFLHSPGNFQVYDPRSKILFSGDLGASMGTGQPFVTDFDAHIPHMVAFHQRYMASRAALSGWAQMARGLDIETIAPQHGAVIRGKELVGRFIDWCAELPCGVDLYSHLYRVPHGE